MGGTKSKFIDQALSERTLALRSEGISNQELSDLCKVEPELLQRVQERMEPERFYSYAGDLSDLHWVNLKTGVDGTCLKVCFFPIGCGICEVPGGPLITTGGQLEHFVFDEVVSIDVRRDFAVKTKRSMINSRTDHSSVYYQSYVYVLGGWNKHHDTFSDCERYLFNENKWEVIPPLPIACGQTGVVVSHSTLLVLGGLKRNSGLNSIQELNLVTLTWRKFPVKFPKAVWNVACFSYGEVYFVIDNKLFTLNDQGVKHVKTLAGGIRSETNGSSCYSNGTIYASTIDGPVFRLEIGSLSDSLN